MILRLPTARFFAALICVATLLLMLTSAQIGQADTADDSVDQQLTDLDQRFDDGDSSPRKYLNDEKDLTDEAVAQDEDLIRRDDPASVPTEIVAQRHQRAKELVQAQQKVDCASLVCPDEPLAQYARAMEHFSVADLIADHTSLDLSYTHYLDQPITLGEFVSRELKQTGTNYLATQAAGLVVLGVYAAAQATPAALLSAALATGTPSAGAGLGTIASGTAATAELTSVGAPAVAATPGVLTSLASSTLARYGFAAALGGTVGMDGLGGGSAFTLIGMGHGTAQYVVGACILALAAKGCAGKPDLVTEDSGRSSQRSGASPTSLEPAVTRQPNLPRTVAVEPGGDTSHAKEESTNISARDAVRPTRRAVRARQALDTPDESEIQKEIKRASKADGRSLKPELRRRIAIELPKAPTQAKTVAEIIAKRNPNATTEEIVYVTKLLTTPGTRSWIDPWKSEPYRDHPAVRSKQAILDDLYSSGLMRQLIIDKFVKNEWKK